MLPLDLNDTPSDKNEEIYKYLFIVLIILLISFFIFSFLILITLIQLFINSSSLYKSNSYTSLNYEFSIIRVRTEARGDGLKY